jgi:hypothetical protein
LISDNLLTIAPPEVLFSGGNSQSAVKISQVTVRICRASIETISWKNKPAFLGTIVLACPVNHAIALLLRSTSTIGRWAYGEGSFSVDE